MAQIYRKAGTEPLTLEEIRTLASHWCPECYSEFQISMEGNTVLFTVCGWTFRKTIEQLCVLQTADKPFPVRLAMELNLGTLFDNMQDIWERERGILHG